MKSFFVSIAVCKDDLFDLYSRVSISWVISCEVMNSEVMRTQVMSKRVMSSEVIGIAD